MQFKLKDTHRLFSKAFIAWKDKDPFRQSAVIAYYAIFSIPGLLVLIISIAGYFFRRDAVNQNLLSQISSTMGTDIAAQVKEMLINAAKEKSTLTASIIGIVVLIAGATGVFVELQKTLNIIWQVKALPQKSWVSFIKTRLFSFGLILAIAFLLTISLVVSTAIAALGNWIHIGTSAITIAIFNIANYILSLAIISALFALMFKFLPDAKIKWKHVWLGGLLTGLLFTIGKNILAYYFGKAHPASVYGAASSIILILLWVSYSSMIMFFGAEVTAAYAKIYSGTVAPTEIAKATVPGVIDADL